MKRYKERYNDFDEIIFDGEGKGYFISVTYQTVTPESAEIGDFEDQGFEIKKKFYPTLEDVIDDVANLGGWMGWSASPTISVPSDWLSTEPEIQDYGTMEQISYNLHITRKDKKRLTEPEIRYIEKELRVYYPAKRVR